MLLTSEDEAKSFVSERANAEAMRGLDAWIQTLRSANEAQNLIARGTLDHIWTRHIADAAQIIDYVPRETQGPWLDFGTGAGIPGIVLAFLRKDQPIVLIESRRLRIEWLKATIDRFGLECCRVIGGDAAKVPAFAAGLITARAFAPLTRLIALTGRFSTNETRWVLPKGRSAAQEVDMLPATLQSMFHVKQSVTDREAGIIIGRGKVERGS